MVLVKNYLNKSKISLLFNWIIFFLFIVLSISQFFDKKSLYNGTEEIICGIIIDVNIESKKIVFELKAKEKLIANYYFDNNFKNSYNLGDKVCLYGTLSKVNNNTIFNLFNYRKYLLSKNIFYTFDVKNIKKLHNNKNFLFNIKNNLRNRISKCNKSYPYILAFVLGDNRKIDKSIMEKYRNTGVSHLFAVSGMHITFVSSFIMTLLNRIVANKKIKTLLLLIAMIFVCSIFNNSPSIMRTFLLFCCLSFDKLFNLQQKPIKYLIIILLLCLIINKYSIYNVGFLFSYIISFFLMVYQNKIKEVNGNLKKSIIISLISFFVSIPILINNFFSINLLTPIFNLIIVPYVSMLLFPFSFLCIIFPFLDNLYFVLINILEKIIVLCSSKDIFNISLSSISIVGIILYYLIILLIINNIFNKKYIYFLLIFIIIGIHHNIRYFSLYGKLYVIDVKQGDSLLLTLKNNKNILIDTGGQILFYDNKSDSMIKNTISFFKSIGVNKLDYLVITHGDYDHMGEAINLVNNFKVEKVIFNCGEYNDLEKEFIKVLNKKKIPYYSCVKELNIDDNKLYFLNNGIYDNENDNSSVIYIELNNHKFLFMGDAGVEVEENLIEKYNLQNIDVIKVGHHGSRTSTCKSFIDETEPKYSVISVGKNNRYGHPNKEVLNTLNESKIYRTDQDGSIMFKIKNNKLKIETCSP